MNLKYDRGLKTRDVLVEEAVSVLNDGFPHRRVALFVNGSGSECETLAVQIAECLRKLGKSANVLDLSEALSFHIEKSARETIYLIVDSPGVFDPENSGLSRDDFYEINVDGCLYKF